MSVDLAGINIDDLSVKRLRNGQGESRLPHSSGTNQHNARLSH